jgi:hypothetical protein
LYHPSGEGEDGFEWKKFYDIRKEREGTRTLGAPEGVKKTFY